MSRSISHQGEAMIIVNRRYRIIDFKLKNKAGHAGVVLFGRTRYRLLSPFSIFLLALPWRPEAIVVAVMLLLRARPLLPVIGLMRRRFMAVRWRSSYRF